MGAGQITNRETARVFLEGQEVCREYFKTERITFGMSELGPGAMGDLDKGHSVADEVFYCARGMVLCHFPEEDVWYELREGDALLIPPGNGHRLFNHGREPAVITWSCAPHQ